MLLELIYKFVISIHALRGEGDELGDNLSVSTTISIHALRGEGDATIAAPEFTLGISIHALRGEGDPEHHTARYPCRSFQSTPSVGRATIKISCGFCDGLFQSTPSVGRATVDISITSLTAELFQSTPSVGRATRAVRHAIWQIAISIHALRGEGDCCRLWWCASRSDFNPRPPWGGRQKPCTPNTVISVFQSTPSVGRATPLAFAEFLDSRLFQSTPSVGRATLMQGQRLFKKSFQSTPSVGRATCLSVVSRDVMRFQSTPSVGRATISR